MLSMLNPTYIAETIDEDIFSDIITQDRYMLEEVFPLVKLYSRSTSPVLISGETGTGKDMIAQKIHMLSYRKLHPFITVNLASVTSTLFESELFGHKKGAFTDAKEDKIGHFEAANGGTIFLDEIGELPKELQGKLLRVIQYREICRVGDNVPKQLDVRIISATNKNMKEQIEMNNFRSDLFYRLNKEHIELSALKNRGNDIELLTHKFLNAANEEYSKKCVITEKSMSLLKLYKFPGNIRELENLIFSAVARAKQNEIQTFFPRNSYETSIAQCENEKIAMNLNMDLTYTTAAENHMLNIWKMFKCNTEEAAKALDLTVRTLQRRLKEAKDKGNPNYPYKL